MLKWLRKRRLHREWKPDYHQYVERPPMRGPRFTVSKALLFESQPVCGYGPPFIPPVRTKSPPQGIPEIAQKRWMEVMNGDARAE